jgi:hypothetical protein
MRIEVRTMNFLNLVSIILASNKIFSHRAVKSQGFGDKMVRNTAKLALKLSAAALLAVLPGTSVFASESPQQISQKLLQVSDELLKNLEISYVYGGRQVGNEESCTKCNQCLSESKPKPSERLKLCPICHECSIDCSHFIQLVFDESGIKFPYLTTKTMLDSDRLSLSRKYQLIDIGQDASRSLPGDLLVYRGHVVLLLEKSSADRGRIIHATGGKDIRLPGQGIQTERNVLLAQYRGPLLRILRHRALTGTGSVPTLRPKKSSASPENF